MKKNILLLCSIGIMSLSLVSCDGKESKLKSSKAENIIDTAVEKTSDNIENILKGNFIGASFNSENHATFKLDVTDTDVNDSFDMTYDIKEVVQANVDVLKLNAKPKADLEAIEFYNQSLIEYNATNKIDGNTKNESDVLNNRIGLKKGVFTQNNLTTSNDKTISSKTEEQNLDEEIYEGAGYTYYDDLTANVSTYLDTINGNSSDEGYNNLVESIDKALAKTEALFDGNLSSTKYVEELQELFNVSLNEKFGPSTDESVAMILDIIKDNNPLDYVAYTQVKSKDTRVIKASLNYESWKNDFTNAFNSKINSLDKSSISYVHLSLVNSMVVRLLPDDVKFNYSFTITNDIISKVTAEAKLKGSVLVSDVDFLQINYPETAKLAYDLNVSSTNEWLVTSKSVSVQTLNIMKQ